MSVFSTWMPSCGRNVCYMPLAGKTDRGVKAVCIQTDIQSLSLRFIGLSAGAWKQHVIDGWSHMTNAPTFSISALCVCVCVWERHYVNGTIKQANHWTLSVGSILDKLRHTSSYTATHADSIIICDSHVCCMWASWGSPVAAHFDVLN